MADISISYKLDLIVELFDTTIGRSVAEKQVLFYADGRFLAMRSNRPGTYILMNHERADMKLRIEVKGYEPAEVDVCYEKLDKQYPSVEVQLIPIVKPYGYTDICELSGRIKGLTDISAISLNDKLASVCAYNAKKNTLRLFSSSRLDESSYAVLHEDSMEFEEFRVIKKTERDLLLYLAETMQGKCIPEEGVARIVRGSVDAKGRYLLRVRKDGKGTRYLIRYIIDGVTRYEEHSFYDGEGGAK